MKKPVLLFASILGLSLLAPLSAQAGRGHVHCEHDREVRVVYDECGHPVRMVKVYEGRDRHGRPVYRWVREVRYVRPAPPPPPRHRHAHYDHCAPRPVRVHGGITIHIGR